MHLPTPLVVGSASIKAEHIDMEGVNGRTKETIAGQIWERNTHELRANKEFTRHRAPQQETQAVIRSRIFTGGPLLESVTPMSTVATIETEGSSQHHLPSQGSEGEKGKVAEPQNMT
jgi:hypothetical protein